MDRLVNKIKSTKFRTVALVLIIGIIGTVVLARIFAAGASANLSANVTSVEKNQTFEVTAKVSSDGTKLTIGQVYLTYDPSKVAYVSTDFSSSSFNTTSPENGTGSGFVRLSRYQFPPPYPSGELIVGKVMFRALVDSGTIDIGIDGSSIDKPSIQLVQMMPQCTIRNKWGKRVGQVRLLALSQNQKIPHLLLYRRAFER